CAEALKSVAAASITSGVELREDANATGLYKLLNEFSIPVHPATLTTRSLTPAIKRYINSHNSVSSSTGVSTSELDSVLKDLERRVSVSESLFRLDPLSPCSLIVWSALLPLFYPESPFGECAHCSHIILPTEAVSFHEELARFFEMVDSLLRSEQILRLFKDDLKTLWSSAPSIAQPNSCTSRPETKACAPKQGSAKPMAKTSQQKAVYSIKQPPANDSATKSVPDLLDDGSSLPTTLPVTEDDLHQATACFKPLGSFKRPVYPVPKLPQSKSSGVRNILITSALPYVNNVPHLGNMIGSTLSASVFALYCDVAGYNVLSICGTDEYGTATEAKALSEHMTPRQICDKYHKLHCDIYSWFDIQFDYFGRTTTDKHQEIVQDLFQKLWENQYITEDTLEQLFCENCSKFLADRFVEGTCPFCKYDDARGDQCDKCGRLMNAIELKQPRCKTCQHSPVVRSSKHLFLDLPKIESKLAAFVEQRAYNPTSLWTTNARTISSTWIRDGLRPRCITRDLNWGVPVPLEEYKNKVFYVWFDAPIGYLSITANYTPEWRHWWQPTPKQISEMGPIELFQFMAKDNVPFHAIIFPACLLAANAGHTLVQHLLSTEYMNYEGTKFSKSRGIGVFGDGAMSSGIHSNVWRFYLLYRRPETQDSAFVWDDFMLVTNCELLNNLGNFINRALAFVARFFNGKIPNMDGLDPSDVEFLAQVAQLIRSYAMHMEAGRLREGLRQILAISRLGNVYFQVNQPWVAIKKEETKPRAGVVIGVAANVACLLGMLLYPFMPTIGRQIWTEQCNLSTDVLSLLSLSRQDYRLAQLLPAGHQIGRPTPLFRKMEPEDINKLSKLYGSGMTASSDSPSGETSCSGLSLSHSDLLFSDEFEIDVIL
ncbi:methionine--tRNA ligase, partial [Opisthorchis viverrini]